MQAIEWLRHLARDDGADASELACEAAFALGALGTDRRSLVVGVRRLLESQPSCGPLWWIAAHLLEARDVGVEASRRIGELEGDNSIDELFAFVPSGAVVAAEATRSIARALYDRPDISVRLLGEPQRLRRGLRYFSDDTALGFTPREVDRAVERADFAIVEALAASGAGFLLTASGLGLVTECGRAEVPIVVLAGVGRVLSDKLFASMLCQVSKSKDFRCPDSENEVGAFVGDGSAGLFGWAKASSELSERRMGVAPVEITSQVITERGLRGPKVVFHPNVAVSHLSCPSPSEILSDFSLRR